MVSRGLAAIGAIALNLIVARSLGAEGLALFTIYLSIVGVISLISRFGIGYTLTRTVAKANVNNENENEKDIFAILNFSIKKVAVNALLCVPVGVMIIYSEFFMESSWFILVNFIVAVPLLSFAAIVSGFYKSRKRIWLYPFFEQGGVSVIASILLLSLLLSSIIVDVEIAISMFSISLLIIILSAYFILKLEKQHENISLINKTPSLKDEDRVELQNGQGAFLLIALAGLLTQSASFILVSPFLSVTDLGLARAAERLAVIVSFPMLAVNPFIILRVVRSAAHNNVKELWRIIRLSMLLGGLFSLPALLVMQIFPGVVLGLLGPEFKDGEVYLRVLSAAHFILVLFGPFAVVMNMGGGERQMMWLAITMLVLSLVSYTLGSSFYGLKGFVTSYTAIILLRCFITFWLVLNRFRVLQP